MGIKTAELSFFVRKVTECCHTRAWTTIQGKQTAYNGYLRRKIDKKHNICTNKRCKNYLKPAVLVSPA